MNFWSFMRGGVGVGAGWQATNVDPVFAAHIQTVIHAILVLSPEIFLLSLNHQSVSLMN